jgi:putative CocE/NonD family hydrolase
MKTVTEFPHKIRCVENLWIPMPDGVKLAARMWLPEDATAHPVPAIIDCLPYRKRDGLKSRDEAMYPYFAGHGYASLRIDLRGTGDSEGLPDDEYTPAEQADLVAAIAWIASQDWCSGNVGMMGISWGGFNSLQVAMRQPPALKAIITVCASDDRYNDDVHYMQGCLLHDNFAWSSAMYAFVSQPPDPAVVGERWREMWLARLKHYRYPAHIWYGHQRRDEYWRQGSACENYDAIKCAVFAVGGWEDGYSNAVARLVEKLRAPCIGLAGPWGHAYPHNALPGPAIGFLQEALRFWDQWLKGRDTGIMQEPKLRVWMNASHAPDPCAKERPGRWIGHRDWPAPRITPRDFWLGARGLEDTRQPDVKRAILSPQPTGHMTVEWCSYGGSDGDFPGDQRADDGCSLCFDTLPLSAPLEFFGAPVLHLAFSVDKPMAKIAVRLNDVAPDSASTRITYTLFSLNHAWDQAQPVALEPGKVYHAKITLNTIAYALQPGRKLRVAISTACWPQLWPGPTATTLTVHTAESRLELPVRPPHAEDKELRPFDPPEESAANPYTITREGDWHRTVTRNVATGAYELVMVKDYGAVRYDDIDWRLDCAGLERYRVKPHDPLSGEADCTYHHELSRGDFVARSETRTTLRNDATHFHLTATVDAYENGQRIFSDEETLSIPRDFM